MNDLIEQIRKDREAGSPRSEWFFRWENEEDLKAEHAADLRRISRVPDMEDMIEERADHIELLDSELREAVRVAYDRGAIRWARRNYPKLVKEIEEGGA